MDYEAKYRELCDAIGYDPDVVDHDAIVKVCGILNRVRITMSTSNPERTGALFICGYGGDRDDLGLPDQISVCPTYGLDGYAVYTKTTPYTAPGY